MQLSALRLIRCLTGCGAGFALISVGLLGFVREFTETELVNAQHVCGEAATMAVIIAWGVILCLAALFPYSLGLRFIVGTLCISISAICSGYAVDYFLMANKVAPPLLALAILVFMSGCHCFSLRKRTSRPQ